MSVHSTEWRDLVEEWDVTNAGTKNFKNKLRLYFDYFTVLSFLQTIYMYII